MSEEMKAKLEEAWKLADGMVGNGEAMELQFSGEQARMLEQIVREENPEAFEEE